MNILNQISEYASICPERTAICCDGLSVTYGELELYSGRLARYLGQQCGQDHSPIAVYGHKHPLMLVSFLACVKSGRAYCPIDTSVPDSRVKMILDALDSPILLTLSPLHGDCKNKRPLSLREIDRIIHTDFPSVDIRMEETRPEPVLGEDIFYIIFTSGSTGTPKGVTITEQNLSNFLDWSITLGTPTNAKKGKVFLNQAPFSFDLSVLDLYTCLAVGGTLWCLTNDVQKDYRKLLDSLKRSGASIMVSTPSFADMCLSDPGFTQTSLPELGLFLFCGETLTNRTAVKLMERFPSARIMNTYGPTESTVAVTQVEITPELAACTSPLPVGRPKPGTALQICSPSGSILPEGEKGEIIILGDTVSPGYYQNPSQTQKHFFTYTEGETAVQGYRTGDKGYMKDGMLYYCGRIDLQIKLHGYRIELEDIENNLIRLPQIEKAAVLPNMRDGRIKSISAYLVCPGMTAPERTYAESLTEKLRAFLPEYMIPKKLIFMDRLPMTGNGKVDRKALGSTVL